MSTTGENGISRRLRWAWFAAAVALVATACFPGEAPLTRFDDYSSLVITGDGPTEATEGDALGYTVVFSASDADRVGIPIENAMIARNAGIPEAVIPMQEHFIEQLDTDASLIQLDCFDPIDIRDDSTGQVVLSVTDFCPALNDTHFTLFVNGVFDSSEPLGWSYESNEGFVEELADIGS